ncbi:DUF4229 domain-containing protein [Nonomuraea jiangxiensis]|uniref:DUF4229 domain-containing protein n=1 Tax=Nonomuraea jiangxiensis TaxID=633440 RepID=UPI000B81424B|nr:DUF4229 domain-containing protein [Nonomuraea jiangxiensis]
MHPVLVYTASRIGLFLVALLVSYLGLSLLNVTNPLWSFLAAFLISGIASYVLLSRQRDAVSERISRRIDRHKPHDD